jgi:hypothetical protein
VPHTIRTSTLLYTGSLGSLSWTSVPKRCCASVRYAHLRVQCKQHYCWRWCVHARSQCAQYLHCSAPLCGFACVLCAASPQRSHTVIAGHGLPFVENMHYFNRQFGFNVSFFFHTTGKRYAGALRSCATQGRYVAVLHRGATQGAMCHYRCNTTAADA